MFVHVKFFKQCLECSKPSVYVNIINMIITSFQSGFWERFLSLLFKISILSSLSFCLSMCKDCGKGTFTIGPGSMGRNLAGDSVKKCMICNYLRKKDVKTMNYFSEKYFK